VNLEITFYIHNKYVALLSQQTPEFICDLMIQSSQHGYFWFERQNHNTVQWRLIITFISWISMPSKVIKSTNV